MFVSPRPSPGDGLAPARVLSQAEAVWDARSYSGSGDLLDLTGNGHDAVQGSGSGADSNDPLFLSPASGVAYLYLPGTAGNSATVTLANSTAYFYTITYHDDTTDTDTQTSSGAGLLTFGGTDAKFAGLKIKRIVVTTDADHDTTVADINFTRRDLYNTARTSLTAVTGQTVTVVRTTSGRKTVVVDRPLFLFGADDYMEIADHAGLNFDADDSFTLVVVVRQYNTPINAGRYLNKRGADVGYLLSAQTTTLRPRLQVQDSGTSAFDAGSTYTEGVPVCLVGVRTNGSTLVTFSNGANDGVTADTAVTGTITNTEPLFIGAAAAAANRQDFELFAAAVFRRALSAYEVIQVGQALGVV